MTVDWCLDPTGETGGGVGPEVQVLVLCRRGHPPVPGGGPAVWGGGQAGGQHWPVCLSETEVLGRVTVRISV